MKMKNFYIDPILSSKAISKSKSKFCFDRDDPMKEVEIKMSPNVIE